MEKCIGIFPIWINALAFPTVFDPKYAMCSLIRKNEINQCAQQIWPTPARIVLLESLLSFMHCSRSWSQWNVPHYDWIDYHKCLLAVHPDVSSERLRFFHFSKLSMSGMSLIPEPAHQQVQSNPPWLPCKVWKKKFILSYLQRRTLCLDCFTAGLWLAT